MPERPADRTIDRETRLTNRAEPTPIAALARLNAGLLFLCKWFAIGLVAAIAVIVALGVFYRYVLNDALSWYEEISKFLMVWLAFIGAPLGFRHGAHVAIELLPPLPAFARRLVRLLVWTIVVVLMASLTHYGWWFSWNGRTQVALTAGEISMFWIFVCIPIGAALMGMVALEYLLRVAFGLPEPSATEDEQLSTQGM